MHFFSHFPFCTNLDCFYVSPSSTLISSSTTSKLLLIPPSIIFVLTVVFLFLQVRLGLFYTFSICYWIIYNIAIIIVWWLFFFLNLFLIGGQLLYSIVLLSAIHQHESVMSIHMSPPLWTSPHNLHPIPPLYIVTEHLVYLSVLCSSFPLVSCFIYGDVYVSMLLSQFVWPSPAPLCPQFCSSCLHLLCSPAGGS